MVFVETSRSVHEASKVYAVVEAKKVQQLMNSNLINFPYTDTIYLWHSWVLTSVPYYSLPAIVLLFASFLALWQRSSGNATKSPRNGGTGRTLICHDEVVMYEVKVCHFLLE